MLGLVVHAVLDELLLVEDWVRVSQTDSVTSILGRPVRAFCVEVKGSEGLRLCLDRVFVALNVEPLVLLLSVALELAYGLPDSDTAVDVAVVTHTYRQFDT